MNKTTVKMYDLRVYILLSTSSAQEKVIIYIRNTSNQKYICELTAMTLNLIGSDCNTNELFLFFQLQEEILLPYRYGSRRDLLDWVCLQKLKHWHEKFFEGFIRVRPPNPNLTKDWPLKSEILCFKPCYFLKKPTDYWVAIQRRQVQL